MISSRTAGVIAQKIIKADPAFSKVIAQSKICPIGVEPNNEPHFYSLATSVLSQQLSMKAASTIIKRVENIAGKITPLKISKLSDRQLRSAGVSGAKARSILELGEVFLDRRSMVHKLHLLSDTEIEELLLPLFGIGPWTVEMFMMFKLGRVDVWPVGDLGVRRGWEKIHRSRLEVSPKKLHDLGEKFSPYRSHAAWYCWRAIELL